MFSLFRCLDLYGRRSLVKLLKLAKDSATFLVRRKSRSLSRGKLVRCTGCEREKAGGAYCKDHNQIYRLATLEFDRLAKEKRKCAACGDELAAWVQGSKCAMCEVPPGTFFPVTAGAIHPPRQTATQVAVLQNQALMRQQLMQMFGVVNRTGYTTGEDDRSVVARSEPVTVVGPLLAYRSWRVRGGRLAALNNGLNVAGYAKKTIQWTPYEPMLGDVSEHGVYAHRKPAHIERDPAYVSGGVWLWGDVIEHEHGFRASFGYPAFLWYVDEKLKWSDPKTFRRKRLWCFKKLADSYGIPLLAVDSLENLPEREGLRERLLLSSE